MRLVRIDLHKVALPLVHVFQTSSHAKDHLEHILVEAEDASGLVGWGEIASPADPYYCSETTGEAFRVASEYLVPRLLGAGWDHPDEVDALLGKVRGHFFAKAGFNIAAWTLFATHNGQSLASALGGTRQEVTAGVSLGIEPGIDALLEQVAQRVEQGYPRVKLKIAPGWDIEPVRAVRQTWPELMVHVDANAVYPSDEQGFAVCRALDEFGLSMIEQPFARDDLLAHAELSRMISTPVCLDESIESLGELRTAIAMAAGSVLNIKVSRMGGLSVARAAHDLCQQAGWPVWCGGMHEFGIGRAANVALSSLPGFTLPSDVSGSDKYYARDIIVPPVIADHGTVQVPDLVGLGHRVDRELIEQHRVEHARFSC